MQAFTRGLQLRFWLQMIIFPINPIVDCLAVALSQITLLLSSLPLDTTATTIGIAGLLSPSSFYWS
jgi:hypothetical protein